jgi:Kdo2-lipid IVA lauroyltransferase/acyltransferase
MHIHCLVESVARALASRRARLHRYARFTPEGMICKLERILYQLVITSLGAFLPAPLAYPIACLRGDWRYRLDGSKREQVMRSLECIFGDQLSLAERARVARDFFRLRACEAVDVMRLAGKGRALARLVQIRGVEHIEAALASGKGAILCSAHFGSFDSCFSLIGAYGFPITVIGRWPSKVDSNRSAVELFFSRLIHRSLLTRHRRRPNIEPRGQLGIAVQSAAILRHNELIAICLDPPVLAADRARAVPMDFLNGQALLLPGATTIAQLTGAPVLMTFLRRSADWRHQVLEISPPMCMDGDAVTAFGRCLAVVEAAIRQNPAHWVFWDFSELVALGLLAEEAINAFA